EPLTEDLTSASTPCPASSIPPPTRQLQPGDSITASFPTSLSASTMTHQHELGKSPTRMPRVVASQYAPQFSQLAPPISSRLTAVAMTTPSSVSSTWAWRPSTWTVSSTNNSRIQETGAPTDRSCSQKGSTITPSRLPQEPL